MKKFPNLKELHITSGQERPSVTTHHLKGRLVTTISVTVNFLHYISNLRDCSFIDSFATGKRTPLILRHFFAQSRQ
jgi:hypothetical protein